MRLFLRHGWIALAAAGLTAACGSGGNDSPPDGSATVPPPPAASSCDATSQKQFVLDRARDAYLYLDLLPQTVDIAAHATASELLDALTATARAQRMDRHFSYLTTLSAEQQFFAEGESIGFGIGLSIRDGTRLFVTQVYEGSPADESGFRRGDEILAVGNDAPTLRAVADLIARNELNEALGPSEPGLARVLRVRTSTGMTVDRSLTKRSFSLDPVPATAVIPRSGRAPVGYVNLRTFISPANEALREAFTEFQSRGVTQVVVDLRYNGGGMVETAELLADLLSRGREGEIFYGVKYNTRHAAEEETVRFGSAAQAIPAMDIAFLTTEATASASELVINSLAPYARTAIIGDLTYGKPVGQFAYDLAACDVRLRLVTFRLVNSDGSGDYYDGLPDTRFTDDFCPAADDLAHAQDDPEEAMLSEALHWIDNGICRPAARLSAEAAMPEAGSSLLPLPPRPSPAQVYQPGFH